MLAIDISSMTDCACGAVGEQQRQPKTASEPKLLRGPPGYFLQAPLQDPVDRADSDTEGSTSERDEDLPSNSKVPLAPPPGVFTQANVSDKSSKIAPPPGVFVQSRTALPCLLGRSIYRQATKQQDKQEHQCNETKTVLKSPPGLFVATSNDCQVTKALATTVRDQEKLCDAIETSTELDQERQEHERCEAKAPLGPPPGVFVAVSNDSQVNKDLASTEREHEKPRDAVVLPPDFRAPPGLEHMVKLTCDHFLNITKPCKLSRAPSEDNLSTDDGSTFQASSNDDLEDISSDDDATPTHLRKPRPVAKSSASVELQVGDLVYADEASYIDEPNRFHTQMPMIPFVPAVAVHMAWQHMAWQQWYGGGFMSVKNNRKQGKA